MRPEAAPIAASADHRPGEEELALRVGAWVAALLVPALALAALVWGLSPRIWPPLEDGAPAGLAYAARLVTTVPGWGLIFAAATLIALQPIAHFTMARLPYLFTRSWTYGLVALAAWPFVLGATGFIAHAGLERVFVALGYLVAVEPIDLDASAAERTRLAGEIGTLNATIWSVPASAARAAQLVEAWAPDERPVYSPTAHARAAEIAERGRLVEALAGRDLGTAAGVTAFQIAAKQAGAYAGDADGILGPSTLAAEVARIDVLARLAAELADLEQVQRIAVAELQAPRARRAIEAELARIDATISAALAAAPINERGAVMLSRTTWLLVALDGVLRAVYAVGEAASRQGPDPLRAAFRGVSALLRRHRPGGALNDGGASVEVDRAAARPGVDPAAAPISKTVDGVAYLIRGVWDGEGPKPPLPHPELCWQRQRGDSLGRAPQGVYVTLRRKRRPLKRRSPSGGLTVAATALAA